MPSAKSGELGEVSAPPSTHASPKGSTNSRRAARGAKAQLQAEANDQANTGRTPDPQQPRGEAAEGSEGEVARVVEDPFYNEVVENSSTDPVVHETVATCGGTATTGTKDNSLQLDPLAFPSLAEAATRSRSVQEVAEKGRADEARREAAAPEAANGGGVPTSSPARRLNSAFLDKVTAIPAVSESASLLANSVEDVARRSPLARLAVNATKRAVFVGVAIADVVTAPVRPALDGVLRKADERAAQLVDRGLSKYPIASKEPAKIIAEVKHTAVDKADQTAHQVLAFKPACYVATVAANTAVAVNSAVDVALHKARLQAPNTHTPIYNAVEWVAHRINHYVEESREVHPETQRPMREPAELLSQVKNVAVTKADDAVHHLLAYKPASFVASVTAKTAISVNRRVDNALHKANLQPPNDHTPIYNAVDWLANGVLHYVDESRSGAWRRTVAVA